MIPSDHFVRFYNEVFKALRDLSAEALRDYWREVGALQTAELAERFREGGLQACRDYWERIRVEENCEADLRLTDDFFEFQMRRCPSLSKALDSDGGVCEVYCDHCMGWIELVMDAAGLHAVMDMKSRTTPECLFRVYADKAKAAAFAKEATLVSRPYGG